jgi:hypothetical protein
MCFKIVTRLCCLIITVGHQLSSAAIEIGQTSNIAKTQLSSRHALNVTLAPHLVHSDARDACQVGSFPGKGDGQSEDQSRTCDTWLVSLVWVPDI